VFRKVVKKRKKLTATRTRVGQYHDLEDYDLKFGYGKWWS